MQIPKRKPGKDGNLRSDPHLTEAKFEELKENLAKLKKTQPQAAAEVSRLAELGDFSENAAYQIAKGRLRGINQKILEMEDYLHRIVIIESKNSGRVNLGSKVTIQTGGLQKTYQILGSIETDPIRGIISHNSPIGSALMGCQVGDVVKIKLKDKTVEYKVLKIE